MLGIAQAIASMGAALSKAFSTGNIWEGIAASITAIATITSVISQMKSLNSTAAEEGAKYHYARGGLVTGPGTGTSDSIPARLSTARDDGPCGRGLGAGALDDERVERRQRHSDAASSGEEFGDASDGTDVRARDAPASNPVVTVRDINNGQRRVKVQDETARATPDAKGKKQRKVRRNPSCVSYICFKHELTLL